MRSPTEAAEQWEMAKRRGAAWFDTMERMKFTPKERYERLRDRYAAGEIDLEDFTASVVALLREGL